MATSWIYIYVLTAFSLQTARAIFIGGEQDVGSPLRVAQCRATCLERVSRDFFDRRQTALLYIYLPVRALLAASK